MSPSSEPTRALDAHVSLKHLLRAISSPTRWRMIELLSSEGPLAVSELGDRVGATSNGASKHIKVLLETGIVRQSNSRLYRLHEKFSVLPDAAGVEFGHCLIRFRVPMAKMAKG